MAHPYKTILILRVAAPSACFEGAGGWLGSGAAGEIRTPDLVLRRHALYPSELQPRISFISCTLACAHRVTGE